MVDGEKPESGGPASKAADLVKKVLTAGVGAAFLTEESLRSLVSELKLPKELIANLLSTANATKSEFFARLSQELSDRVGSKIDPSKLLQELLEKNEIELNVKVRFKPRERDSK